MKKLLPSEELAQIKLNRIEMWRKCRKNISKACNFCFNSLPFLAFGAMVVFLLVAGFSFIDRAYDDHKQIKFLKERVDNQSALICNLVDEVQRLEAKEEAKPTYYFTNVPCIIVSNLLWNNNNITNAIIYTNE